MTDHQSKIVLSEKDTEIINYRRSGLTIKEISCTLFLSRKAIEKRLQKLRSKAEAKNDIELINFLHSQGFFDKVA